MEIKRPGVGGKEVKKIIGSQEQGEHEPKVVIDETTSLPDGNTSYFKAKTTKEGGFSISAGLKGFGRSESKDE